MIKNLKLLEIPLSFKNINIIKFIIGKESLHV